jgi:hypothetical protein
VSTGIAFRQQQFAQRSSLLVASDSRCQTTTARYKCNRVANTITLNSRHLLKKIVPTILMCRRFRENQSERGEKGFRVPLLPVIGHHPIGLDAAVGAYDDGAITSAFRGVDTIGDISPAWENSRQSGIALGITPLLLGQTY